MWQGHNLNRTNVGYGRYARKPPEWRNYPVSESYSERSNTVTVLWCMQDDPETNVPHQIGHSFPDSDPDRHRFTETTPVRRKTGNSFGRDVYQDQDEETTVIEMCGYHWNKVNPFRASVADAEPPAIEGSIVTSEAYNKGWEDAEKHFATQPGASFK